MEKIKNNPIIINDSKSTNLNSTEVAINAYKEKINLILGGYSNEPISNDEIIKIINRKRLNKIICYGQVGFQLHEIIKKYKKSKYIKNFGEATKYTMSNSTKNEIILLSPGFKSFDQFNNYEERGNTFKKHIVEYYKK